MKGEESTFIYSCHCEEGQSPDVAAQLSATKERYRCGVPLAGAIRFPRQFRSSKVVPKGGRIATPVCGLVRNDMEHRSCLRYTHENAITQPSFSFIVVC